MSRALRDRRERLAREITDIAKITRIKGSYLKSIEDEEYDKLPVEVYTRGYIRKYAEFLGVPSDEALSPYEKYLDDRRGTKGKESAVERFSAGVLTRESHDDLENIKKILMSEDEATEDIPAIKEPRKSISPGKLLWLVPLVMIAFSIYLLTQRRPVQAPPAGQEVAKAPAAPVAAAPAAPPGAAKNPEAQKTAGEKVPAGGSIPVKAQPKPQPAKEAKAESAAPAAVKKKFNLNISATETTWIQFVANGSERKQMLLNPGEKVNYSDDNAFSVKIGNAGGVVLTYNGKELKALGKHGEVVVLSFPERKSQPAAAPPRQKTEPAPVKEPGVGKAGAPGTPDSPNTKPSRI